MVFSYVQEAAEKTRAPSLSVKMYLERAYEKIKGIQPRTEWERKREQRLQDRNQQHLENSLQGQLKTPHTQEAGAAVS